MYQIWEKNMYQIWQTNMYQLWEACTSEMIANIHHMPAPEAPTITFPRKKTKLFKIFAFKLSTQKEQLREAAQIFVRCSNKKESAKRLDYVQWCKTQI